MAGIEEYLEQIEHAVYGKDVRQAIHDGIEQCYNDVIDTASKQELITKIDDTNKGLERPIHAYLYELGVNNKVSIHINAGDDVYIRTVDGSNFSVTKVNLLDANDNIVNHYNLSVFNRNYRRITSIETTCEGLALEGETAQGILVIVTNRVGFHNVVKTLTNGEDLDTLFTPGEYLGAYGDTYLNAPDGVSSGRKKVYVELGTESYSQFRMEYVNVSQGAHYERWYVDDSWDDWYPIGFGHVMTLSDGDDLNELSKPGMYDTSYAHSYVNAPDSGVDSRKEIFIHKPSNVTSIWFMYYINHTYGKIYTRMHSGTSWSPWSELSSGNSNAIQLNNGSAQNIRYPLNDTYGGSGSYANFDPYTYHKKVVTLLHCSDIHGHEDGFSMLMDWANANRSLYDDILFTGDIVDYYNESTGTDYMAFWKKVEGAEKILVTIGNHDAKDQAMSSVENWVRKPIARSRELYMYGIQYWGVTSPTDMTCWYKDYDNSDLRLIGIDGTVVAGSAEDESQKAWLVNVLTDAKANGKSVVMACHYEPQRNTRVIACDYSAQNRNPERNANMETPYAYYGLVQNFINGGGEFICWLVGHTHTDWILYDNNYPDQIAIVVTSLWNDLRTSDQARTKGTSSFVAGNMVGFDTDRKLIKMARIGANYDFNLRPRDVFVYNYQTKTIVRQSSGMSN